LRSVVNFWRLVSQRSNVFTLILALPLVVLKKFFRRCHQGTAKPDGNYINPLNIESALQIGNQAVAAFHGTAELRDNSR
jgi:hypothetical protein